MKNIIKFIFVVIIFTILTQNTFSEQIQTPESEHVEINSPTDSAAANTDPEAPEGKRPELKIENDEDLMKAIDDIMGDLGDIMNSEGLDPEQLEKDMMEIRKGIPNADGTFNE